MAGTPVGRRGLPVPINAKGRQPVMLSAEEQAGTSEIQRNGIAAQLVKRGGLDR